MRISAEAFDDAARELCLSRAQLAVQRDDFAADELPRQRINVLLETVSRRVRRIEIERLL